jgi:hypothetical protein
VHFFSSALDARRATHLQPERSGVWREGAFEGEEGAAAALRRDELQQRLQLTLRTGKAIGEAIWQLGDLIDGGEEPIRYQLSAIGYQLSAISYRLWKTDRPTDSRCALLLSTD